MCIRDRPYTIQNYLSDQIQVPRFSTDLPEFVAAEKAVNDKIQRPVSYTHLDNMTAVGLYPIIHLKGEDIEIAFTHTGQYGEEYYSFVNGQHTTCLLYTSPGSDHSERWD